MKFPSKRKQNQLRPKKIGESKETTTGQKLESQAKRTIQIKNLKAEF